MRHTASPLLRLLAALCLLAMLAGPALAAAEDTSIVVADYAVSPAVLQPGDLGTITATIRNTASTASLTETGNLSGSDGGTIASTRRTDITVNIERVRLSGGGVEVLSGENTRVGAIGPGLMILITVLAWGATLWLDPPAPNMRSLMHEVYYLDGLLAWEAFAGAILLMTQPRLVAGLTGASFLD